MSKNHKNSLYIKFKNLRHFASKFRFRAKWLSVLSALTLSIFALIFSRVALAQIVPDVENAVIVSATIPDHEPPSTPILIAPEDEANLNTAYPVFQWYASHDNMGMSHYRFWMDNATFFDNIPLDDFANSEYSLDYDPSTEIFTFVAADPLAHGPHRWQIIAVDEMDNSAASDIWDFNIYTDEPEFTIDWLGDVNVNIEATDPSTVPEESVIIFVDQPTANEPWIIAFGDATVSVALTVTIPGDPTQYFSQDVDENGDWELQLGILPRDTDIRLDFTITDIVGHQSQITELYIRIYQQYWPPTTVPPTTVPPTTIPPTTIPPTTVPPTTVPPTITISSSISPSITLVPSVSTVTISSTLAPSVTASPSVSLTPSVTMAPPGIRIPIIPPKEIVHELSQEVVERLPEKVADFITQTVRSNLWKLLSFFMALISALIWPALAFLLLLFKFKALWSKKLWQNIFLALWPWPKQAKNLVFEYRTSRAVPLVKVQLEDAKTGEVLDWQITSFLGQFSDFAWPKDRSLRLRVQDQNFYYPVGDAKPAHLSWQRFYQGEIFNVAAAPTKNVFKLEARRVLTIPTLLAQGQHSLPLLERLRTILAYFLSYQWWFWGLSLLPVLLFALRYPTLPNYLAIFYYLLIAWKKWQVARHQVSAQIQVMTSSGQKFKQNLVLIADDLLTGRSQALSLPFELGLSPKIQLNQGLFLLSLQDKNYVFWNGKQVIDETYCQLEVGKTLEYQVHRLDALANSLALMQPLCQLLPPPAA